MSDCCSPKMNGAHGASVMRNENACPVCGQSGKPVDTQTVKALLSVSLRAIGEKYVFCRTPDCPVVYFAPDGQTFTVEQLRERVYQKSPNDDDVFVCYCFIHTVGEFRGMNPAQRSVTVDDITLGTKINQCACDIRNPQGECCLGNVRALIKRIEAKTVLTY